MLYCYMLYCYMLYTKNVMLCYFMKKKHFFNWVSATHTKTGAYTDT